MLIKACKKRCMMLFICSLVSLYAREDLAVKEVGVGQEQTVQPEVKPKISQEEQMALLKRLRAKMTDEQKRSLTGASILAIIPPKKEPEKKEELEKIEVVKEVNPVEQELLGIERRLNSSSYVGQNDLKKIGSDLYGSLQKKLGELPKQEEETDLLRKRAVRLAEQLSMFERFVRLENAFKSDLYNKELTGQMIERFEIELKNIKDRVQDTFEKSSSFSQRLTEIEKQIKEKKSLMAKESDQEEQNAIFKMERYLTVLEDALKKEAISPEVIKNIRISLDEMAAPGKLNFSAPQQAIFIKRIDNVKKILGMFDHLFDVQLSSESQELSPVMAEAIAEGLRNVQKELEQLGLPNDLVDAVNKHIAKVNNRLVPRLFEFLDQLARDASGNIETLDVLKGIEHNFNVLKKMREYLDVTESQDRDLAEKFLEIDQLLNQQRESLLEQQKRNEELERIAQEQEQARQMELQKQKELQEQKEREERELQEAREREDRIKREEQEKRAIEQQRIEQEAQKKSQALIDRAVAIENIRQKINLLIPDFLKSADDWSRSQNEEAALRSSFYTRTGKPEATEQDRLKNLKNALDQKKHFMALYTERVKTIHNEIDRLYKASNFDKKDLEQLLQGWIQVLLSLQHKLQERLDALSIQTSQKRDERKSYFNDFIERNQLVVDGIGQLIVLVRNIRIADDNKLVLIERAIEEQNKPKIALKPKRRGAFSKYF